LDWDDIFDWDDDDDRKRNRHHSKKYRKRYLTPVNKPIYKEECGACHFAYQPELLPSGSWEKILAGLEDHFGEVKVVCSEKRLSWLESRRVASATAFQY